MALNLTRLLALFSVFCVLATTAGTFSITDVESWASSVGTKLSQFFEDATHYKKLQEGYQSAQLSLSRKDGTAIANKMKQSLEAVLQEKIDSIKNLAAKAAELRKNYTYDPSLKGTDYFDSKDLQGLPLQIDPKFSTQVEINKSSSVVHIPTDVYKGGVGIVNTIKWTSGLTKYFKENVKTDPSLLWQYFGSADGVYRVFPGFAWVDPEQDIFDHRRRGWYIQGSSSPKDIVLILDLSGSMAGQNLAILKLAALSLLETLQENDYVNIIAVYNEKPLMVCQLKKDGTIIEDADTGEDCTRELLQATAQNKKFLRNFVPNGAAKGIARASKGFDAAIKVLQESRENKNFSSSDCTQAVILFTDGIENSESEKSREILEEKNADKRIRVFTYLVGSTQGSTSKALKEISNDYRGCLFKIQTISDVREKVLSYVSVLSRPLGFIPGGPDPSWTPIYLDQLGLGLMNTLVAPVFNTSGNKELLGVVGTDVALPQLEGAVPSSEVGVNGYGFAINNNGFVLFHPGLDKEKDPPNIALNELEYNGDEAKKLMLKMIDRSTGNMTFTNRLLSEDKHRLSFSEKFHYFYSPIVNTSFSAAIAIPELGVYSLDATGFTAINNIEFLYSKNNEDVIVAPWKICPDTPVAAINETPVYEPAYANSTDIINDQDRVQHCDEKKLKRLLFDANVTQKVAESWDANENIKNKIQSVFVGTHGGIMRLLNTESESPFTERDYIKEQFYTQAAQYANKGTGGKEIIVFSTPYRSEGYQPGVNETTVNTASSPVVYKNDKKQVVAAVAGMQFDEDKMKETFQEVIANNECNNTEEYFCRLIDDDGFILATNRPDNAEVGKFFGVWEGAVLKKFIDQTLFKNLTFGNVQGECKKPEPDASSARTLLNPLFAVTSYVQFWTQTVFWSLMQFNIYSFFSRSNVALAEVEEKKVPCTQKLKFYKGVWENRTTDKPEALSCPDSNGCDWPVFMAAVDGTNLRLVVVVKRQCKCDDNDNKKLTTKPEDLPIIPTPRALSYRKPPESTSFCNEELEEGKPPCAMASLASPQSITVIFLLILAFLIPCNDRWR
ncbi:voltage-dependent calcium channel subunit alpha-2/delta-3-like isoform X2 [Oculina patagonica]